MSARAKRIRLAIQHAEEHRAAVRREQRLEVIAMHLAGEPKTKIRDDLAVSLMTIDKWLKEEGLYTPVKDRISKKHPESSGSRQENGSKNV